MRAPVPHQLPYRADIDGLRAVAVLLVVAFHAWPLTFPGGFIGVDVFFVISGFLISSLIFDALQKGNFRFADFYARRIRRIFPALLIVLAASFAAGWFLLLPGDFRDLNRLVASGVFFVPNLTLWSLTGYFGPDPEKTPLLHLWSLGVEEQFYLGWPLLAVLFWKRGTGAVIALAGLISFGLGVLFIAHHTEAVFYLPVTRLWELMAGAWLAWRERGHLRANLGAVDVLSPALRSALAALGSGILLVCGLMMNSQLLFPGWWALPPVLATMLVISAGPRARFNRRVLAQPMLVSIGLISYPLYLWHWPILSLMKIWNGEALPDNLRTLAVLASFVLAWLTYRLVEKPIRSARDAGRRRHLVLWLLAAGLGVAAASLAVLWDQGVPQRYPPSVAPFLTFAYDGRNNKPWRDGVCFLEPTDAAQQWKDDCIDPPSPAPLVMLWGDSHAAHLIPGLEALQHGGKFRLGRMTGAGCPPVFDFALPEHPSCPAENNLFFGKILSQKPDTVILAAAWDSYRYDGDQAKIANLEQTRIFSGLDATIARLRQAGIRHIMLIGPVPIWKGALPAIVTRVALADGGRIPQSLGPQWREDDEILKLEMEMRPYAKSHGVDYVSMIDALCLRSQCRVMATDGPAGVMVFDSSHFTKSGSEFAVRRIAGQILTGLAGR